MIIIFLFLFPCRHIQLPRLLCSSTKLASIFLSSSAAGLIIRACDPGIPTDWPENPFLWYSSILGDCNIFV